MAFASRKSVTRRSCHPARPRLSPIFGYLTLGVVLSASGLGTLVDADVVQDLAELAVVFLTTW